MNKGIIIANRFREVILNGTWIANTNFQDQLKDLNWQQATHKVAELNTIAALTFHINYYIAGLNDFFSNGKLAISDKYSFDHPPIQSAADWQELKAALFDNAEKFAETVSTFSDDQFNEVFVDEKYGTYERNIEAMIEHSYYHLGQVVLVKKMIVSV